MCPLITGRVLKKRTFYCCVAFFPVNCNIFIFLYLLYIEVFISLWSKYLLSKVSHCISLPLGTDVGLWAFSIIPYRLYNVLAKGFFTASWHYWNSRCRIQSIIGSAFPLASLSLYFPITFSLWCFCMSTVIRDETVCREFDVNDPSAWSCTLHCVGDRAQPGTCCTLHVVAVFGLFSPFQRASWMFVCEPRWFPFLKWKNLGPYEILRLNLYRQLPQV